jgi:hypothetical protein
MFLMKLAKNTLFFLILAAFGANASELTFGDMAVLLAKGYFRNHVKQDASVEQCAAFLNGKGIYFSLFDLIDPDKTATKEDCARVVGQSVLLFSGEADIAGGSIKKPAESETWVDYCLLNDIDLDPIWSRFVQRTEGGSLPEVRKFFGR